MVARQFHFHLESCQVHKNTWTLLKKHLRKWGHSPRFFCAKIQATHNVGGREYNGFTKERKKPRMFDDVINEEAIQELTPEQVDQLLSILEKAGY